MTKAKFTTGTDAFDSFRDDLLSGKPPVFYPLAEAGPVAEIELGPQRILLIGGAPGAGKTAFVMQTVFDALRLTPDLRTVVCNVEMPPGVLLERQLARLAGVGLNAIRYRNIPAHLADQIDAGLNTLEGLAERVAFCKPPFTLENVAATADAFAPLGSGDGLLLVLDYIQRIKPPGSADDKRGSVDASMNYLRQFADAGAAVVVVSSVGRQKDKRGGSTYAGESMNLASFKESGELEFGADDAFILAPVDDEGGVELKHLKSRHGQCRDIQLTFDGRLQTFTASDPATNEFSDALRDLWDRAGLEESG